MSCDCIAGESFGHVMVGYHCGMVVVMGHVTAISLLEMTKSDKCLWMAILLVICLHLTECLC